MERVVIDIFGQMWGTLVLNSISFVFCVAGLLGICAKDSLVIFLVSSGNFTCIIAVRWNIYSMYVYFKL